MGEQTHTPDTQVPVVIGEHVGITPGLCGGKPHILGHRIKVQHVVIWHERMGMTPDEIVATYPGLTLADVHAALSYYHDHREAIRADIQADEEFVAQMRANSPPSPLQEKLKQRNGADSSGLLK